MAVTLKTLKLHFPFLWAAPCAFVITETGDWGSSAVSRGRLTAGERAAVDRAPGSPQSARSAFLRGRLPLPPTTRWSSFLSESCRAWHWDGEVTFVGGPAASAAEQSYELYLGLDHFVLGLPCHVWWTLHQQHLVSALAASSAVLTRLPEPPVPCPLHLTLMAHSRLSLLGLPWPTSLSQFPRAALLFCSNSVTSATGNTIGIALSLQIALGSKWLWRCSLLQSKNAVHLSIHVGFSFFHQCLRVFGV